MSLYCLSLPCAKESKAQLCECLRLSSRVLMAQPHMPLLVPLLLGSGWKFPVRDMNCLLTQHRRCLASQVPVVRRQKLTQHPAYRPTCVAFSLVPFQGLLSAYLPLSSHLLIVLCLHLKVTAKSLYPLCGSDTCVSFRLGCG